jgi:hypothetical protein
VAGSNQSHIETWESIMGDHDKQHKSTMNNWLLWSVVIAVGAVVGFLFLGERQFPASTMFLILLFFLCPAIMFFMMRGMTENSGDDDGESGG